jgi:hypothetical protein
MPRWTGTVAHDDIPCRQMGDDRNSKSKVINRAGLPLALIILSAYTMGVN